jgi:hypothetical protein
LVCKSDSRLGNKGSSEIKAHPFFKGINWLKIKEMKPPFIPQLSSDYDFKYFDHFDYLEPFIPIKEKVVRKRNEPEFTGYTFKGKENDPTDILSIINLIQKKKIEVEKDKEKKNQNISELKSFSNVETNENKTTQDSSNYNSINTNKGIKENKENKEDKEDKANNDIKIIPIKVNPNSKCNTNKNSINVEINKKKNNVIKIQNIKKSKISTTTIQKQKMPSNSKEKQTKKPIKIDIPLPIKKKSSLLQNVSHSFKSGFKKVFSSSRSKGLKNEVKNK